MAVLYAVYIIYTIYIVLYILYILYYSWGLLEPARFDRIALLSQLETLRRNFHSGYVDCHNIYIHRQVTNMSGSVLENDSDSGVEESTRIDKNVLEAMGVLYSYLGQYEEALSCYMDISMLTDYTDVIPVLPEGYPDYHFVFELIEKRVCNSIYIY